MSGCPQGDADKIDPDVLLAAVIEAIAENLSGRDAQVIPLREREEDAPEGTPSH